MEHVIYEIERNSGFLLYIEIEKNEEMREIGENYLISSDFQENEKKITLIKGLEFPFSMKLKRDIDSKLARGAIPQDVSIWIAENMKTKSEIIYTKLDSIGIHQRKCIKDIFAIHFAQNPIDNKLFDILKIILNGNVPENKDENLPGRNFHNIISIVYVNIKFMETIFIFIQKIILGNFTFMIKVFESEEFKAKIQKLIQIQNAPRTLDGTEQIIKIFVLIMEYI